MISDRIVCKICGSKKSDFLFRKDNFDIMKCSNCKIVYTNIPENFDLLSIYDKSYFQGGQEYGYGDYAASEKVLRNEFSKSVRILKSLTMNQPDLKLLELGSAYGYFLDEARDAFDCIGLEVSKDAAQYSIANGNKVLTDYYDEATAASIGKVDIVAMFDVIEHLPDPLSTIQLIDKNLNKGGLIYITTGDIDSVLAKITGKKWRLMTPPQHTFFFSRKTLSTIFEKLNYKLEIVDRPWKTIPLGLAFYQIVSRLGFKMRNIERMNNISLTVNLFDTVRIIARKK